MFEMNTIHNIDCMIAMKKYPDNFFDIAIVDPPYGLGIDGQKESINKNPKHNRKKHIKKDWDNFIPSKEYFKELERISKNQIIWGANYFVEHLNKGTKGWIIWDKGQRGLTMSDCEIAFSSFNKPTRVITINRGILAIEKTIHPTQKPIKLYEKILKLYASKGIKIIDTHAESGSCLIACHRFKEIEYIGFEIDKDYYTGALERLNAEKSQVSLFDTIETNQKETYQLNFNEKE